VKFLFYLSLLPTLVLGQSIKFEYDTTEKTSFVPKVSISSVVSLFQQYKEYDSMGERQFFTKFSNELKIIEHSVNHINGLIQDSSRKIYTVRILSGIGRMYESQAFFMEQRINIPSFFLFSGDKDLLKLVVDHESAHMLYFDLLVREELELFSFLYMMIKEFYYPSLRVFTESTYIDHPLGHPEDSEGEMFSSMYAILNNEKLQNQAYQVFVSHLRDIGGKFIIDRAIKFVKTYTEN
jgi:hypothetical protein